MPTNQTNQCNQANQTFNSTPNVELLYGNIEILTPYGGKPTVSSVEVAEHFGKKHCDVLRKIEQIILDLPSDFNERNFALVEYADTKGERRPMYRLTRDGFTLLAMGFTGKKALKWKIAYIEAFNLMEEAIMQKNVEEVEQPATAAQPASHTIPLTGFPYCPYCGRPTIETHTTACTAPVPAPSSDECAHRLSTTAERKQLRSLVASWSTLSRRHISSLYHILHTMFGVPALCLMSVQMVKEAEQWVLQQLNTADCYNTLPC